MTCEMRVLGHWRRMAIATLLGLCSLWAVAGSLPQGESEDSTRRIWKKRFREARVHTRARRPRGTALKGDLIGVTIWRLREDQNKPTAERATADTLFNEGERVRLSIEAPRECDNYLYVIDREVFADGTMGDPYLIFPSQDTPRQGNIVTAGKPVYVPAQDDHFTLVRARKDQVREILTIIITPTPLKVPLGMPDTPAKLDRALVAQWEKKWGGRIERRDEKGGAGKQWTEAERNAGGGERRLLRGDPLPQTIYLVKVKPGRPMLLHTPLQIKP
jgi:Domain of unknown function (DUF4384)